jgi:hypothetical protein
VLDRERKRKRERERERESERAEVLMGIKEISMHFYLG